MTEADTTRLNAGPDRSRNDAAAAAALRADPDAAWADSRFEPERGTWRALWTEVRAELAVALAAYAALLAFSHAIGYRMYLPYWYIQLLDPELLRERLWESIWYLHAQPPLMNLMLGLALRFADAVGAAVEAVLLAAHVLAGAALIAGWVFMAGIVIRNRLRRRVLIGLLALHPVLYMVLFEYFYTFHEMVLLGLMPLAVWAYLNRRSLPAFAALCVLLALLTLERSLFHFLWSFAIAAAVARGARRVAQSYSPLDERTDTRRAPRSNTPLGEAADPRRAPQSSAPLDDPADPRRARGWSGEIAVLALLAVALIAWPLKNEIVFGKFTYSTWQGYSLSKGLGLDLPPDGEAVQPPAVNEWDVPALIQVYKPAREGRGEFAQNWNHYVLIAEFERRQQLARETLLREPWRLPARMLANYWYFSRFTGRNPHSGVMGTIAKPAPPVADLWLRLYEMLLVQEFRSAFWLQHGQYRPDSTPRPWHVSGFFFTFPLIVFFAAHRVRRLWIARPVEARTAAFMLAAVLWVFLLILFIDGDEANRIRTSTEPFVIALAFWIVPPNFIARLRSIGRKR